MNSTPKVISATEYDINKVVGSNQNELSIDIDKNELFKIASQAVTELILHNLQTNDEFRVMLINNLAEALLSNTDLNEVFFEKLKTLIKEEDNHEVS